MRWVVVYLQWNDDQDDLLLLFVQEWLDTISKVKDQKTQRAHDIKKTVHDIEFCPHLQHPARSDQCNNQNAQRAFEARWV
jgi:hypothetical protein